MSFNPSRLATARKRRLLNKKELADLLNVDLKTIVRWERSHTGEPTPENLDSIVNVLGFPEPFFFGPTIDDPICEHISFRSQKAMSAAERDAALAAGQIGFLISDWVQEQFELPKSALPDLHLFSSEASVAAKLLRTEWGIGEKPIPNMTHLLESKGVRVFSLAENTTHVNAYSLWRRDTPYVFLNTFKSAECSRFDAAHELAHLVLHQDGKVTGRIAEEQANRFASSFLMPEGDVLSTVPIIRGMNQLITSKKRWRVSLAALTYRIHELNLVSDWRYRSLCIEMNNLGYNTKEPEEIEREKSMVWDKVLKTLWGESTTPTDIAEKLHLPESELFGLLCGVLTPKETPKVSEEVQLRLFGEPPEKPITPALFK